VRVIGGADDGLIANISSAHNIKVKKHLTRVDAAITGAVIAIVVGFVFSWLSDKNYDFITILSFVVIGMVVGILLIWD